MSLPSSILLAEPQVPETAGSARVLRVYGDQDDPLRLTVLLAAHLATMLPARADVAATCLSPRSAWKERLGALSELLLEMRNGNTHYAALIDPDGLARSKKPSWEDRASYRMSQDLRRVLVEAVDRGGWLLARPNPSPTLDDEIDGVQIDVDEGAIPHVASEHAYARFAPDVRPTLTWLIGTKRIAAEQVDDILEEVRDPNAYVVSIAYDALPESARTAARSLSAVRAPSHANGSFGGFAWSDKPRVPNQVRRTDVLTLERAGFLVRDDLRSTNDLVMPRRARSFIESLARTVDAELTTAVHRALASDVQFEEQPVESQIEIHHHAARTGDVDLTRRTARYFGFELRALATERSRSLRDYDGAARLFRELVTHFDRTDAYAWEYLGYNLALASKAPPSDGRALEILEAYESAHRLDKQNPLYFGRLLGFRAQRGLGIRAQFEQAMQRYASYPDASGFVSWFVGPIFDGLLRGGRSKERDELLLSWRPLLEWCAPRVLEKHAPGSA
jgi:hypothetical protein